MKKIMFIADGPEVLACGLATPEQIEEEQDKALALTDGNIDIIEGPNVAEALQAARMRRLLEKLRVVIENSEKVASDTDLDTLLISPSSAFCTSVICTLNRIADDEKLMTKLETQEV